MESEKLDLLKRLQPFIREKMGEWFPGDQGVTLFRGEETPFLVYKVFDGGLLSGVICVITDNFGKVNFRNDDLELMYVPDVYSCDPERPERGLIGMLNREITIRSMECYLAIFASRGLWEVGYWWYEDPQKEWMDKSLDIALLKALCYQEGV